MYYPRMMALCVSAVAGLSLLPVVAHAGEEPYMYGTGAYDSARDMGGAAVGGLALSPPHRVSSLTPV